MKGKRKTMKHLKKVFAFLLVALLVLSLSAVAFAADSPKIIIANNDPKKDTNNTGEVYKAYKIFDAVKATGTTITTNGTAQTADGPITYRIAKSSPWFSVLFDANGDAANAAQVWFTATKIEGADPETWQVNPTATTEALTDAKTIADWLLKNKPAGATAIDLKTPAKGEAQKENTVTAGDGYYLVTSTLGTNLGLATTDMPFTVVEKNTYPSVEKKQNDKSATDTYSKDVVNVQVGDTIYYEVTVDVPATAKGTLTVTDTMSSGLNPAANTTVTAKIDSADLEKTYEITVDESTETKTNWSIADGTNGYVITIDANENTVGKTIKFYMTATVNDKAIITDTTKVNEVELVYSNYTQKDSVNYETGATGAIKYDGATGEVNQENVLTAKSGKELKPLAGATFELQLGVVKVPVVKHADGYYYPKTLDSETEATIVTEADGKLLFRGLDKDTDKKYTLVETKAPDGYNLLTSGVELVIAANNTAADGKPLVAAEDIPQASIAKIANNQGTVLPSTGGIGTTIFYVVGGVLVLGAAVMLITKKRMTKEG